MIIEVETEASPERHPIKVIILSIFGALLLISVLTGKVEPMEGLFSYEFLGGGVWLVALIGVWLLAGGQWLL